MTASHHAPGGRYRNPWPETVSQRWYDAFRVVPQHWRGVRRAPSPERGTIPVATPSIVHPQRSNGEVSATWIGHATVLLQIGALNVLTDPMFSKRAFPVQWMGPRRIVDPAISIDALPPIDVVLLSHNHYDHLDRSSVKSLARAHPRAEWVVPPGLGPLLQAWGAGNVVELDWWQQVTLGDARITATPARHFSSRGLGDRNRSLWCGFALEAAGSRVYFAGDTAYHPEFTEIGAHCGPFDFVMIPVGAYEPRWFMQAVHVNPEEAVRIYQDLVAANPNGPLPLMLGIHWGTFRLTFEPFDEPPRRARARWREAGLDDERLWIGRHGETRCLTR